MKKKKVTLIDPPSGWLFGFPKELPEGVTDIKKWLVENGYPQTQIDRFKNAEGVIEYFPYRIITSDKG